MSGVREEQPTGRDRCQEEGGDIQKAGGDGQQMLPVCSIVFLKTPLLGQAWSLPRAAPYQDWLYIGVTWGDTQLIEITELGPRNGKFFLMYFK